MTQTKMQRAVFGYSHWKSTAKSLEKENAKLKIEKDLMIETIQRQIVEIGKLNRLLDPARWRKESDRYRLTLKEIRSNPDMSRADLMKLVNASLNHRKKQGGKNNHAKNS